MNEYPLPDPHGLEDDQFGEARTSGQTTDWSDPYGMELLPADGMSLQQSMDAMDSKMPQFGDFTMVTLENIKPEPDWEQGFNTTPISNQTAESTQTPQSDAPMITAVAPGNRNAKKRRSTVASSESLSSVTGLSNETSKEKNRIAASKCRKKKKVEETQLEERRRSLQTENTMLQESAAALRNEVLFLKNEVLRHGTCDFAPIQNYIVSAAAQLHGMPPA